MTKAKRTRTLQIEVDASTLRDLTKVAAQLELETVDEAAEWMLVRGLELDRRRRG
jgi:hypothetical protein